MVAALLGISPPTFVALSHYSVVWLDHMCYLKKKKKRDLGLLIIMNWGTFIQLGIKSFGYVNSFCTCITSNTSFQLSKEIVQLSFELHNVNSSTKAYLNPTTSQQLKWTKFKDQPFWWLLNSISYSNIYMVNKETS